MIAEYNNACICICKHTKIDRSIEEREREIITGIKTVASKTSLEQAYNCTVIISFLNSYMIMVNDSNLTIYMWDEHWWACLFFL